ncbi:MAG: hypothetical protein KKD44_01700 [Proteobacteria bacterium]|nr:hypothetical protein [Pseudomonadota bacterium]
MNRHPQFLFSITDSASVVDEQSELWLRHLPANRHPGDSHNSPATTGHYFKAASRFLSADDYGILKTSALGSLGKQIRTDHIETIAVCLVKHGTFYHPSKVDVVLDRGDSWSFALNLAVSSQGLACVEREYAALERLSKQSYSVPAVYGKGHFRSDDHIDFSMFAAQWFDDYHEFHIHEKKIIVWNEDKGHYFLSEHECDELYHKAAFIMTCCYNVETCEQIQPWHHAAGDFVVKKGNEGLDVKLITVRQYTSIFQEPPDDGDERVEAALIFLINLSIRMRLDREDGIGKTVWADDRSVAGVVRGFWDGLGAKRTSASMAPPIIDRFAAFIVSVPDNELMDFAIMLIQSYHPESPDLSVIRDHLDDHISLLCEELKKGRV